MSTRDIPVHAIRTSISRLCLKEGGGGRQRGERGRGFVRRGNELLEGERMRARSPVYICADIESDIIHRVCARSYHTLLDQRALHTDVHADMHTALEHRARPERSPPNKPAESAWGTTDPLRDPSPSNSCSLICSALPAPSALAPGLLAAPPTPPSHPTPLSPAASSCANANQPCPSSSLPPAHGSSAWRDSCAEHPLKLTRRPRPSATRHTYMYI